MPSSRGRSGSGSCRGGAPCCHRVVYMKRALCTAFLLLAVTSPPALAGSSLNKVLVIGTDGTRSNLVKSAIKSGEAPNFARVGKDGFERPSLLMYGPNTLTLSEVGW